MIHLAALPQPFSCFALFQNTISYRQMPDHCDHSDEALLMYHGKEKMKLWELPLVLLRAHADFFLSSPGVAKNMLNIISRENIFT